MQGYPKKILFDGDTLVAITKPQLIEINRSLNDYVHTLAINSKLNMEISMTDSLINHWKTVSEKREQMYILESQRFEKSQQISEKLSQELKKEKKKGQ